MADGLTFKPAGVELGAARSSGHDGSPVRLEVDGSEALGANAPASARRRQAMGLGTVENPALRPLTLTPTPRGAATDIPNEQGHDGGSSAPRNQVTPRLPYTHSRTACVAAVRAYLDEMSEAGSYPGMNGYQAAARGRSWPSAKTVVARLGSWPEALLAAGFDAPRCLTQAFVTREDCVDAVAAYAAEAARRGEHPGLVGYERIASSRRWPSRTTVTTRLGPWTAALHAAGVSVAPERHPNEEACLVAVRSYVAEMNRAGLYPGLRGYEAIASSRGWPSVRVVTRRLGSWGAALSQGGFTGPTRFRSTYVTRQDCIAAVQAYVAEATTAGRHPGVLGYDALYRNRGWPQRQSTVMARLGSWSAALSAAGYSNPIHQRAHRVSRRQCLAAVGSYLAETAENDSTATLAGYGKLARSRGWPAVATVLARLGSWQNALRLADRAGRRTTPAPSAPPSAC